MKIQILKYGLRNGVEKQSMEWQERQKSVIVGKFKKELLKLIAASRKSFQDSENLSLEFCY